MAHSLVTISAILALAVLSFSPLVLGQWIRGTGEFIFSNVTSDYMYRFRVAVTPLKNLVYAIDATSGAVAQYAFNRTDRGFADAVWKSNPIPGLVHKQPVMNVDTATNRVYFIHPVDGKIYCYDASQTGRNNTSPVWVSPFVCAIPSNATGQHHQTFSATDKRLLARCNSSIVMLGPKGAVTKVFASKNVQAFVKKSDFAMPLVTFNNLTRMVTWYSMCGPAGLIPKNTTLEVWNLDANEARPVTPIMNVSLPAGVIPSGVNVNNASNTLFVLDANSSKIYLYGMAVVPYKLQGNFNFQPVVDPAKALEVRVLPTPAMVGKMMYGIVQGREVSPFPWIYPDTYYFWTFALNCTNLAAPKLLWISNQTKTAGALAPQIPWITAPAFFMSEYLQNSTRGYRLDNGRAHFNVPADPLSSNNGAYANVRGAYKMGLPWVSPDGMNEVIQYDNALNDANPSIFDTMGYIRTLVGIPQTYG